MGPSEQELHERWIREIADQLRPVLEGSNEGVYVYLDDAHKLCNERLAKMWGFASAKEWAAVDDFLNEFVVAEDRGRVATAYRVHIQERKTPERFRLHVRRKDGVVAEYETDMVPFSYAGQMLAYHFVREVGGRRN